MIMDAALRSLMAGIAAADDRAAFDMLSATPTLATSTTKAGATRATAAAHFLTDIDHYIYAGDTALHIAAAAYRREVLRALIALGADVTACNRRGATPLHYAVDGNPQSPRWDPSAQSSTVRLLIEMGADPNAIDKGGTTPLHRAVRNRCAAAVHTLLEGGADPHCRKGNGSTPMMLATRSTGRGGSGSPQAKAQQAAILELLR